jgi:hypothetical protein
MMNILFWNFLISRYCYFVSTFGFMNKFIFGLWGFIFKLIWNIDFNFVFFCICEQTSMSLCLWFPQNTNMKQLSYWCYLKLKLKNLKEEHHYNSWFFLLGFLVKKPKSDRCKKNHLVNLDKSFYTCPTQLGSKIGPHHFHWQSDWQND